MTTDLFLATYNRPDYLQRTLSALFDRTASPLRLHVVDDGSIAGNQELLESYRRAGCIETLILRRHNQGFARAIDLMEDVTESDPVIRLDDDQLCPLVEPDWLDRLLDAMDRYPDFGIIALNAFSANTNNRRHVTEGERRRHGEVTECLWAAHYSAIRRCVFEGHVLHQAAGWPDLGYDASKVWAQNARQLGLKVGYLTETYTYHFGHESSRPGIDSREGLLVEPLDPLTLEPPEEYRW